MRLQQDLQTSLGSDFRIERQIGIGGMSHVFLARDATLNRDVVIKVLRPELACGVSIERFKREIQIAAGLQHPHIVPVLASGEIAAGGAEALESAMPYYTMPYVRGVSLRERLTRPEPIGIAEALGILRDIARALAYAHRHGIAHRDIKPENVLLTDGVAVVTDFGIAKALSDAQRTLDGGESLTQAGGAIGTPAYMAPEQAAGNPDTDHRADIYALGVVAYEVLTGNAPFHGRTPQGMLAAHISETPPPLDTSRHRTPESVAALVMRCLAKDRGARPQSADVILRTLDAAVAGLAIGSADEPLLIRRAIMIYAVAFVAVVAVAWAAARFIGLPNWVVPGAAIVMAVGLPLVALTGAARLIAFRASRRIPSDAGAHRTWSAWVALAVRASRALSWRRLARGGAVAVGTFAVFVVLFMGLRATGVGPAASLFAAGTMKPHTMILVADFGARPEDSTFARLASGAVRLGLDQARVVRVMTPDAMADALQRMRRDKPTRLTLEVAREIARRERIGAIVDGDVVPSGDGFLLTVRLVGADSGTVLASADATAGAPHELLKAADKVSRDLRARIGESFKDVRSSPPLEKVTTASYEALEKYTEAMKETGPKAVALLKEAVAIDTAFAMAWRRLSAMYFNTKLGSPALMRDATERAYRFRAQLTERERRLVEERYFSSTGERQKVIASQEEAIRSGDSSAFFRLAASMLRLRQFARAETLQRAHITYRPNDLFTNGNLAEHLFNQGKLREADSAARAMTQRFGDVVQATWVACLRANDAECERRVDSLRTADPSAGTGMNLTSLRLGQLVLQRGQLARARRLAKEQADRDAARGATWLSPIRLALWITSVDLWVARRPTAAIARLDSLGERNAFPEVLDQVRLYAIAGRGDRARTLLTGLLRTTPDSTLDLNQRNRLEAAWADVALADGRWADAIAGYKAADSLPDGPANACTICLPINLAIVYDRAGTRDSAIVMYERYLHTPLWTRFDEDALYLAHATERLGHLYEAAGNREKAIEYTEKFAQLWREADAELQPRAADARARLKRLRPQA